MTLDVPDGLDELAALRLLVANSTDMLSRYAPDGTYLFVSPACRELLGYQPQDLLGRSAYDLFHPDDLAAVSGSHGEVLQAPQVSTVEHRLRHQQGHWVWLETTSHAVHDPDSGEVVEIQTSSRDVSFRKEADARVRKSEQRFRHAMTNAPIGMALVGLDGSWLEVNQQVCQIMGLTQEQLRELTFQDITHPDDLYTDLAYVQQLLTGEIDRYSMEKRYLHAAGHLVPALLSGSLVRDEEGEPSYFIAQIQDITERKRYEEDLRRANDRLAASNAELDRFASVASHDLRSPLVTIHGFLDLALTRSAGELPRDAHEWIERAQEHTDRLFDTVDALLQLARVGHQPLSTTAVEASEALGDALEALGPQLEAVDAQLDLHPLPTVEADRAQLRLVFQNLISNAITFRHPDRTLTITVRATERDTSWDVVVQDSGVSFDLEDAEVMFEPFRRTASGDKLEGAGIGLATCRRIIERHGGTIRAEPLPEGARITFTLPKPGHLDV